MRFVNNNQREGFSSNSVVGANFEKIALEYFQKDGHCEKYNFNRIENVIKGLKT